METTSQEMVAHPLAIMREVLIVLLLITIQRQSVFLIAGMELWLKEKNVMMITIFQEMDAQQIAKQKKATNAEEILKMAMRMRK